MVVFTVLVIRDPLKGVKKKRLEVWMLTVK